MAPIPIGEGFWTHLLRYFRKDHEEDVPIITPTTAALLSVACTLLYVLPFYLFKKTRPSPQLSRDAPTVIRARIRAVTFSCIIASSATVYIARQKGHINLADTLEIMGWWPINVIDIARSLALVAMLFIGPLFKAGIAEGRWKDWALGRYLKETLGSSVGWRNYIAGPITEEVLFRSVIISLHLFAKVSTTRLIFLTPLYFGIAHIHHFYEFTLTHPYTPLVPSLLRSLFQFAYTSVFGFYAAFLYLRTGSLPAVILAHSFCNWMGLPRFWGRVRAPTAIGPPDTNRKEDGEGPLRSPTENLEVAESKLHIGWTVVYYVLLCAGAVLFFRNLWLLTDSSNALVSFEKPHQN